jgi:GDP-mannose 4,6 dehydratase
MAFRIRTWGATPEQAQAVNELGTQHLASAARDAPVKRFVFTSTGLVYGSNGGRLAQEDDPCAPTAAYPVSKLGAGCAGGRVDLYRPAGDEGGSEAERMGSEAKGEGARRLPCGRDEGILSVSLRCLWHAR